MLYNLWRLFLRLSLSIGFGFGLCLWLWIELVYYANGCIEDNEQGDEDTRCLQIRISMINTILYNINQGCHIGHDKMAFF